MVGRASLWVKEHPIITFFILAYAISWIIVAPLVASAQGFIDVSVPFALHYLNDDAPLSAAIITTAIANGTDGLRELFQRMIKWRVGVGWVLVAAFSPLALFGIATGMVIVGMGEEPPDLSLLGSITYLPYLGGGGWIFWILTAGIGEESGWRGYALPSLQGNMSALSATLIVTLLWVRWHLPRFFYYGNYMILSFSALPLTAQWLSGAGHRTYVVVQRYPGKHSDDRFVPRWLQLLGRLPCRYGVRLRPHKRVVDNLGRVTGRSVQASQPFSQRQASTVKPKDRVPPKRTSGPDVCRKSPG